MALETSDPNIVFDDLRFERTNFTQELSPKEVEFEVQVVEVDIGW